VSVEMGMIAGTLVHLTILLYSSTKPKIQVNQVQVRINFLYFFNPFPLGPVKNHFAITNPIIGQLSF